MIFDDEVVGFAKYVKPLPVEGLSIIHSADDVILGYDVTLTVILEYVF